MIQMTWQYKHKLSESTFALNCTLNVKNEKRFVPQNLMAMNKSLHRYNAYWFFQETFQKKLKENNPFEFWVTNIISYLMDVQCPKY